ncbi:hypothetical protein Goshw_009511 [Gossypium schwendimanii]|uniref:Uncharacterized protein n=1 Tax=Gossypium schwendimanii TaxID=34291 RepID=A0A7J9MNC4_GOSSC|nr:hypothetical protein [Gossypium schwendimanii]
MICEFYNAPYFEKDFVDEGKGKGEWKCHPSTEIPTSFNQWPESQDFLSTLSDDLIQKSMRSNGEIQAIYEAF